MILLGSTLAAGLLMTSPFGDDARLDLEARFGTDVVEQGVSLTLGGPGVWLKGEYGGESGLVLGLDAHNIDFVPNGALDRNLFVRLAPYVGWRWSRGEHWRLGGLFRYVLLPDAIPDSDYAVLELSAQWRERGKLSVNHSADRFGLGESSTAYEAGLTWPLGRGLALAGQVGWHDFSNVAGDDYVYAGLALVASSARFDLAVGYQALNGTGDRLFDPLGSAPGWVMTLTARQGPAPSWAAQGPAWLDRLSASAELRSQYISSGITQTFGSPAVQLAVEVASTGGTYFEIWGSNVDYVPDGGDTDGADVEIDYTLGHRIEMAGKWGLVGRISYYTYPGAENRSDDWDEAEAVVEATWDKRLRLKVGYVAETAGVDEPRVGYAVRWRQPLGDAWSSAIEVGYKDKRDWGQSYEWAMAELARPIGPISARLRYWYTSQRGRRDNGTADPAWEFALAWSL
jgi:uncharacterized protein (TIGR02001 family)